MKKNHICNPKILTITVQHFPYVFPGFIPMSQFFDVVVMMVYVQSLAMYLMT